MITDLDQKAYSGYFENSEEGCEEAMQEYAKLALEIENCCLKLPSA